MTKKSTPPPIPKQLISAEEVDAAIKECKETVKAILTHYADFLNLLDDGVETELNAAIENLETKVNSIQDEQEDLNFEYLLKHLKNLDHSDIDTEKVLNLLDEDEVLDYVKEQNPEFVMVKLMTQNHKDRLRNFLEAEIYTSYNEQRENILF